MTTATKKQEEPKVTLDMTQLGLLGNVSFGARGISARSTILSNEAAEKHKADKRRTKGTVVKIKTEDLKEVNSIGQQTRLEFKRLTLPWDDNGYRFVPYKMRDEIRKYLTQRADEFNEAMDRLVVRHSELEEAYVKEVGKQLAAENPFPTVEEMRSGFTFNYYEQPLPNPNDIRLQASKEIAPEAMEKIKNEWIKTLEEKVTEATQDILFRLVDIVDHLHGQLTKDEGRLFESLTENVGEVAVLAKKLNIADDAELHRLITRVQTELASLDIVTIRTDDKQRDAAIKTTTSVLDDLRSYGKKQVAAKPKKEPVKVAKPTKKAEPKAKAPKKAASMATAETVAVVDNFVSELEKDLLNYGKKN